MKITISLNLFFFILFNSTSIAQNKVSPSTLYSKIDTYFEAGTKNGFAGAIAVIKNGEVVINKGYGFANRKSQSLNNPNTIFDIGSNTKQFTATAILKLVEMEKINERDPISLYFNNLPNDKKNITIHQLLTHTAGFPDVVRKDFVKITTKDFFEKVFATKLLFTPGEKYKYSNTGYSVLGRIIELASGLEYENFLNQYLFIPAKMNQTGYLLPKWDTKQISRSYNRGVLEDESPILKYQRDDNISWYLKANGGINSTQNDMVLWYKALKSNKIISSTSFQKLTRGYAKHPVGTLKYGYGWTVKLLENNTTRIAHNGSNGAYSHSLIGFLEDDIFISYATNANSEKVEYLAYRVAKMLLDKTYTPEPIQNNVYAFAVSYMENNNSNKPEELIALLKEKYTDDFTSSRLLNSIGNILLMINEHKDWAVALFRKNIELYPGDGNLWDSLGDGYKANNQIKDAVTSYQKAVELGYTDAQEKINKLAKNL